MKWLIEMWKCGDWERERESEKGFEVEMRVGSWSFNGVEWRVGDEMLFISWEMKMYFCGEFWVFCVGCV